jgi:hypothetical protein
LYKKIWRGWGRDFVVLLGFLRGVLEKVAGWWWFFAGVNVVDGWCKRGALQAVFNNEKHATFFELYFCQ